MTQRIRKILTTLFGTAILLAAPLAHAEVAPFGQVIGAARFDDTFKQLQAQTSIKRAGTNEWSLGPMLEANGRGLGIDGLDKATFIFNSDNILVGVILELPKYRYPDIKQYLSGKYTLVSQQEPFVGNRQSVFRDGDVSITLGAPHMSFDMQVLYVHQSLQSAFDRGQAAKEAAQEKREGAQF